MDASDSSTSVAPSPAKQPSSLPTHLPVVPLNELASWRDIDLSEDRQSGTAPVACIFRLLALRPPASSPEQRQRRTGPTSARLWDEADDADFILPNTVLYCHNVAYRDDGGGSDEFTTLVDWFLTVRTTAAQRRWQQPRQQVVRRQRQTAEQTNDSIIRTFVNSRRDSSPAAAAAALSPSSSHTARRSLSHLSSSAPYRSSYSLPVNGYRAEDEIVARYIALPPSSGRRPAISYLTAAGLRAFLQRIVPGWTPKAESTGRAEPLLPDVAARRQKLYADIFHAHPYLSFDPARQSSATASASCAGSKLPISGILQQFSYPPSGHSEVLRAQWKRSAAGSRHLCVLHRFGNTRSLHEPSASARQRGRCWQYAADDMDDVDVGLVVRGELVQRVETACAAVANHVSAVTGGELQVGLMTVFLSSDSEATLQLLWCDKLLFLHEIDDDPQPQTLDGQQPLTSASGQPSALAQDGQLQPMPTSNSADEHSRPAVSAAAADSLELPAAAQSPAVESHAPFMTAVVHSNAALPAESGDDDDEPSVRRAGVDIEHIGPADSWGEQVWRVVRARHTAERDDMRDYEKTVRDAADSRKRDEALRQAASSTARRQQEEEAKTQLLSPASKRRGLTTADRQRGRRGGAAAQLPALTQAAATLLNEAASASRWEDRGLVHHLRLQAGQSGGRDRAALERERREAWEGGRRGKKAALQQMEAANDRKERSNRRRPHTAASGAVAPAAAVPTATSAAPPAVSSVRPAETAMWSVLSSLSESSFPRPLPLLLSPACGVCIRCGLNVAEGSVSVRLQWLMEEDERLKLMLAAFMQRQAARQARLQQREQQEWERRRREREEDDGLLSPSLASPVAASAVSFSIPEADPPELQEAIPRCILRLFPGMTAAEYAAYRGRRDFAGTQVEVCRDCGDWCRGASRTAKQTAAEEDLEQDQADLRQQAEEQETAADVISAEQVEDQHLGAGSDGGVETAAAL